MQYFEDFQLGDCVVTRARTVTETDIVNFACFSGDWHPMHTDAEYAKATVFGERVAHGMLILSLATGLWSHFVTKWAFVAFYGLEGVKFRKPVKIADTVHVDFEVIEKVEKDDRHGLVCFKQSVKNIKGEVVSEAVFKLLIKKK